MRTSKQSKGIIYRIYNSSASDKIISIIDNKGKKITLIAKGVRKPNSKKAYSIDLGNYIQTSLVEGYNIPILTEVKLLNEFRNWKNDINRITILQYLCEVIDKFSLDENPDYPLFQLFYDVLNTNTDKPLLAAAGFSLEVLKITGHLPELAQSIFSEDLITENGIYSVHGQIGYVSEEANGRDGLTTEPVSINIYKTQKYILAKGTLNALKINLSPVETEKLFRITSNWIEFAIENKLKSKDILLKILNT